MAVANKRSTMALFSDPSDHYCHRVRIVLAEKGVTVDVIDVQNGKYPEEMLEANPYGTTPTLLDRELNLYNANVMMEYLDERFPHPPLLPVYPVARANSRQLVQRIEHDWCRLADIILAAKSKPAEVTAARKELRESLIGVSPIFAEMPFFMSEEFSLVDCCLIPILWRLPLMDIELPRQAKPLQEYMERMFARESVQTSLSKFERDLR